MESSHTEEVYSFVDVHHATRYIASSRVDLTSEVTPQSSWNDLKQPCATADPAGVEGS